MALQLSAKARPYGWYLVVSENREPFEHYLTDSQVEALNQGLTIALDQRDPDDARRYMYRQSFRDKGVLYAFTAWRLPMLEWIATNYVGEYKDKVRGLAACIITGTCYGADSPNPQTKPKDDTPGGGLKASVPTPTPPPKPSSGATISTMEELYRNSRNIER